MDYLEEYLFGDLYLEIFQWLDTYSKISFIGYLKNHPDIQHVINRFIVDPPKESDDLFLVNSGVDFLNYISYNLYPGYLFDSTYIKYLIKEICPINDSIESFLILDELLEEKDVDKNFVDEIIGQTLYNNSVSIFEYVHNNYYNFHLKDISDKLFDDKLNKINFDLFINSISCDKCKNMIIKYKEIIIKHKEKMLKRNIRFPHDIGFRDAVVFEVEYLSNYPLIQTNNNRYLYPVEGNSAESYSRYRISSFSNKWDVYYKWIEFINDES